MCVNRIRLKIDGMMCGMCEAHINDTIRKVLPNAKKVSSSHKKGEASFVLTGDFDRGALEKAINDTGYILKEINSEDFEKKNLWDKLKKK